MFAYCNNNPVRYQDQDGRAPDSFGGMVGELIGEFLYELFTGNSHPSHQTRYVDQTIIEKQNKLIVEEAVSFVQSDEFPKAKAATKMATGAKDIAVGVAVLFAPDPSPANELAAVRQVTWGIVRVSWGFAELIAEVVR